MSILDSCALSCATLDGRSPGYVSANASPGCLDCIVCWMLGLYWWIAVYQRPNMKMQVAGRQHLSDTWEATEGEAAVWQPAKGQCRPLQMTCQPQGSISEAVTQTSLKISGRATQHGVTRMPLEA